MRNLKRALSLAVASVMLLGMMIVGTGAVSVDDFNDADQINNVEAATITTGLGLFAGADGNFLPNEPVTRAQMATIICKMLYGNDVNADNFKGAGTFTDTANYQSGWAEGYINMCASLGIVSGYNETTYGPGDTVTTWQASLMLQRALGYWNPAAGEEINELTVTTKGTQLGFYGDLTLSANEPLAREDVAVMAFNALFAQRVSYNVDRNVYVKANDFSIAVTNGTEDEMNTLAQNTFGMYVVEGVVAANGTTNAMLAEDNNTGAKTNVIFDEPVDVDRDGRATDLDYDFIYGTDMDMIGHAAKVYYKIVRNAPEVYAITDNAVKVETVTSGSSFSATVREAGFNRNTANTEVVRNYSLTDTKTYEDDLTTILISNSSDLTVDYAIQLEQTVDYVRYVTVRDDGYDKAYSYYLEAAGTKGVDVTGQQAYVADTLAKGDYVIVTGVNNNAQAGDDYWIIQKAQTAQDMINSIDRHNVNNALETYRLAGSGAYDEPNSTVTVPNGVKDSSLTGGACTADYAVIPFADVSLTALYTLIFSTTGELVAVAPAEETEVNYAYVAQFGIKINTEPTLRDRYVLTAHVYFADGTNGVYTVNTSNVAGNAFYGEVNDAGSLFVFDNAATNINKSYSGNSNHDFTVNAATDPSDADDLNQARDGFGPFLRLYDVTKESNNRVLIKELTTNVQSTPGYNGTASDYKAVDTLLEGVTYAGRARNSSDVTAAAGGNAGLSAYTTNRTSFFYVDGDYNKTGADALSVGVVTGIANVASLKAGAYIGEAYATYNGSDKTAGIPSGAAGTYYWLVNTELVVNQKLATADSTTYYYDGLYNITGNATDGFTLTYYVHDRDGANATLTYQFDTYNAAYNAARYNNTSMGKGWVRDAVVSTGTNADKNNKGITYVSYTGVTGNEDADGNSTRYIAPVDFYNALTYGDEITMYTAQNNNANGVIATSAVVVDLTGNGLTSLSALTSYVDSINAYNLENFGDTTYDYADVAYYYDSDKNVEIVYVTSVPARGNNNQQGQNNSVVSFLATSSNSRQIEAVVTTQSNWSGYARMTLMMSTDSGVNWIPVGTSKMIPFFSTTANTANSDGSNTPNHFTNVTSSSTSSVVYKVVADLLDPNGNVVIGNVQSNITFCQ